MAVTGERGEGVPLPALPSSKTELGWRKERCGREPRTSCANFYPLRRLLRFGYSYTFITTYRYSYLSLDTVLQRRRQYISKLSFCPWPPDSPYSISHNPQSSAIRCRAHIASMLTSGQTPRYGSELERGRILFGQSNRHKILPIEKRPRRKV